MMTRFSALIVAVIGCFFSLNVLASVEWELQLDCYAHGVENAETTNSLFVTFWNGTTLLTHGNGTVAGHVPSCGIGSAANYYVRDGSGETDITHVVVQTTGDDAFWIDQVVLRKDGYEKQTVGMDNNKGWCLSTDKADTGHFPGGIDSGCHHAIKFNFPSGKAFGTDAISDLKAPDYSHNTSYPLAQVANYTKYHAKGRVHYMSALCEDDDFSMAPAKEVKNEMRASVWSARSRGVCLIDKITASLHGGHAPPKVIPYDSSGTSYGNFMIQNTASGPTIFSKQGFAKRSNQEVGKSPGFAVHNRTDWPLLVSLEQLGCLYSDIVDPGKTFVRDTGAVWFTLKVNIQPDGKVPADSECMEPVLKVLAAVYIGALTGGYGSFAALATGAATASSFSVLGAATGAALASINNPVLMEKMAELIMDNGSVQLEAQYAGYPWPGRCDKMPEYEVTGGPDLTFKNGKGSMGPGKTFTLRKLNDCGDPMMVAKTRVSASQELNWDAEIAKALEAGQSN